MAVDVVLVDFGNTLVEETWMRRDCDRFPSWTQDYLAVVEERRADWNIGKVRTSEVADRLAERLAAPTEEVWAYMTELCRSLQFFPGIGRAVMNRKLRGGCQALVTVNPDLIEMVTVEYDLLDIFNCVVASWDSGTDDKVRLCRIALGRLPIQCPPSRALLIDNIEDNVAGWMAAGGHGYVFTDDDTFVTNVSQARVPGFRPADVRSPSIGRPSSTVPRTWPAR